MNDLTDKWKKGELPGGWYWVEGSRAEGIYAYTAEYLNHMYSPKNSDRIIEPVPTFDELQNINKSVNDLMTANIKLVEENTKLKELLKECQSKLNYCTRETYELQTRINEALGEDK